MISAFKHIRLSGQNLIPTFDSSSNTLRLSLGGTGLAYYNELTGLSGHLRGLINTADDDVTRINGLSGAVTITGGAGVSIGINSTTNTITISGADSGYFQGLVDTLTTNLTNTGSNLNIKIDNLSGFVTGTFVRKLNQQVFNSNIPVGVESTGILFPLAFSSTPSTVNVTLETAGDVMYMVGVRGRSETGYFADFSDIVLENTVKLNTFASNQ